MNNASIDDKRILTNLVKDVRSTDENISYVKFEPLLLKYKNRFYLHSIQHLSGNGARTQRYFLSFLYEFKGISRSGLDLMSSFGVGMPLTSFDRSRKEEIEGIKKQME